VPPLPHHVIARAADQPAAVEGAEYRALVDAVPDARVPGRELRRADGPERTAPQVELGVDVVARAERPNLDAGQRLTRAFP